MTRARVAGVVLAGFSLLAGGCRGSATTARVPVATIAIPAANPDATRLPEPVVEVRAGATLGVDVTLAAGDPRRTLTVWVAEPRYLDALGELCQVLHAPPEPEEMENEGEPTPFEANVAAWRAGAREDLGTTCAADPFVRSVVTLEGEGIAAPSGKRRFHASIEWIGRLRLGGRSIDTLRVATAVAEQPSTQMPVPARDIEIEAKPIVLDDARFVDDHALDDLFAATVLLPTADGRYARGETVESSYSPMFPPITTGWSEASLIRASLGAVSLRAHGDRVVLAWEGHRATLDMSTIAQRSGIADVTLDAVEKRGGKIYALLSVSTFSRGRPMGGFCGAGTEGDLVSVALGDSLDDVRTEPLDSCSRTVTSDLISKPGSTVLVWRRSDFSSNGQTDCVKYDRTHPEKAFTTFACQAPKTP